MCGIAAPVVVACATDDYLSQPGRDSRHHLLIHEHGASRDVRPQRGRRAEPHAVAKLALCFRVAVRAVRTLQRGACQRHNLTRDRRILCDGPVSIPRQDFGRSFIGIDKHGMTDGVSTVSSSE
jgi:hypothetical protein